MSNQPPSSPYGSNPQARPVMAQAVTPYYMPQQRRGSAIKTFFLICLICCFMGSVLFNLALIGHVGSNSSNNVVEEYYSHNELGKKKIAIITLDGTILTGEGFIAKQIKQATDDESVCGVVFRVNSPGGTIYGSDQILHDLKKMKNKRNIPVVVSMGGVAASGGYYVSMVVGDDPNTIFAEPTTWTGSIGVKIPHYDLSKLLNEWGIQEDTIASHELKTMGSIAKPMTEQEKVIFQTLVDQSFDRFKEVIRSGRPQFENNPEALDALATGQVFSSQQALENGLVDKIGYLEDAVERAISMAKVKKTEVRVVEYKTMPTLFSVFTEGRSQQNQVAELKALLNLNSPQAFYILSWDE